MHHFYRAAGEAECHGPEGALARPVGYLVECCAGGTGEGVSGGVERGVERGSGG